MDVHICCILNRLYGQVARQRKLGTSEKKRLYHAFHQLIRWVATQSARPFEERTPREVASLKGFLEILLARTGEKDHYDHSKKKEDINREFAEKAITREGDIWVIDGATANSSRTLIRHGISSERIFAVNQTALNCWLILCHQLADGMEPTQIRYGEFHEEILKAPERSVGAVFQDGTCVLKKHYLDLIWSSRVLAPVNTYWVTLVKRGGGGREGKLIERRERMLGWLEEFTQGYLEGEAHDQTRVVAYRFNLVM